MLALAANAQRRLAGTRRLGSQLAAGRPGGLGAIRSAGRRVVTPSHMQIARVVDGGLDAAIAWADARPHLQLP
jgi:hypothetical protein